MPGLQPIPVVQYAFARDGGDLGAIAFGRFTGPTPCLLVGQHVASRDFPRLYADYTVTCLG